MKVVVIDDEPTVLEVVSVILRDLGHDVTTRTSAMGASSLILSERPDIVLIDIGLPDLAGDEWLRLWGPAAADASGPAFVVFSSRSVEELQRIVRETRALGYIRKQDGPAAFEVAFSEIVQELGP